MRLLFASKKRSAYLIRTILVLSVLYLVWSGGGYHSSSSSSSSQNVAHDTYIYAETDSQVNTSSYERVYARFARAKKEAKLRLDKANARFKRVVMYGRRPASLYKPKYSILTFTRVFHMAKFCEHDRVDILEQCPFKNCAFTCDRNVARYADVVIFHAFDLLIEDTESKVYLKNFLAKLKSRRDQIWILWHDEPEPLPKIINYYKFNWTLSYTIDSEISDCSYGCTYEVGEANGSNKNNKNNNNEKYQAFTRELEYEFKKRKTRALWFVSNCNADFRNNFALALKLHIDVRIFGKCREQFMLDGAVKNENSFSIYSIFWPIISLLKLPFNIISYIFNLNKPK